MARTRPPTRRERLRARFFLPLALTALIACREPAGPAPSGPVALALELIASGLDGALYVTAPPGDSTRLFVVQRSGLVHIIQGGGVVATPFLDLRGAVSTGNEQGLLSIAFHPAYALNGYVYASYTNPAGDTRIVRYTLSASTDQLDPASADTALAVGQPFPNHNGGLVAFGPDGYLYVGLGDGGSGGDPQNHGQTLSTLLGALLRLDVDRASPYAVPAANPFVGKAGARPEIWAYGLRNPWRFSFDRATGDLYVADVGQSAREEVSRQAGAGPGGENYGWKILEGSACHSPPSGCSRTGLTLPVYEYPHTDGCSVTGGYVYRGSAYPTLQGRYFFGDFCGGWIRSFLVAGGEAQGVQDHTGDVGTVPQLSSFGEGGTGELYVVSLGGNVWRITAPSRAFVHHIVRSPDDRIRVDAEVPVEVRQVPRLPEVAHAERGAREPVHAGEKRERVRVAVEHGHDRRRSLPREERTEHARRRSVEPASGLERTEHERG